MHETAKRLLAAGLARGEKDFTGIARRFGASEQSATNWKSRGVPKAVIIRAATEWQINPGWLSAESGAKTPEFVAKRTGEVCKIEARPNGFGAAQSMPSYEKFTEEERRLLAGSASQTAAHEGQCCYSPKTASRVFPSAARAHNDRMLAAHHSRRENLWITSQMESQ